MAMIWENIVVTAKEYLSEKNINDSADYNEPFFKAKISQFNWEPTFTASTILAELVWKQTVGKLGREKWNELDRIFSVSVVATQANFRGSRSFKTGNIPELGAIAFWKRGNSWQGYCGIVVGVSEDKSQFDIIDARYMSGSQSGDFLEVKRHNGKITKLPFKQDKLNLIGFVYPPDVEMP